MVFIVIFAIALTIQGMIEQLMKCIKIDVFNVNIKYMS